MKAFPNDWLEQRVYFGAVEPIRINQSNLIIHIHCGWNCVNIFTAIDKLAIYYDRIFGKCSRLQNKGWAQLLNVVLCKGPCITATKNSYHQPSCDPLSALTGHGTYPFGLVLVSFRMWSVWLRIVFWAAVSWRWSSTSWGFSGWFLNCLISSRSCLHSNSKLISLWLIYDISALEGLVLEVSCWIVPLGRV